MIRSNEVKVMDALANRLSKRLPSNHKHHADSVILEIWHRQDLTRDQINYIAASLLRKER